MLDELHVENVALIRDATFAPATGLTVVTGETGAGKTALLSAIKLLIGERADAATVREGSSSAMVEGRFFLKNAQKESDSSFGFDREGEDGAFQDENGERIVVRKVSSDGRSRASLNGSMATVKQLAATVGSSVDLCGQHEHQHLLKPANHAAMLDAWAGEDATRALRAYRVAFDAMSEAEQELARVRDAAHASSEQLEQARFVLARIDEVNPSAEEYERLLGELPRVENAEALVQAGESAHWELSREGGALDAIRTALRVLEPASELDSALAPIVEVLTDASYALEDAGRDVRRYCDGVEHDPSELASMQARLSELQGLMRAYGPRIEDVIARREEAARTVAAVDDADRLVAAATKARDEAEANLRHAASLLDDVRKTAAPRFSDEVNAQMRRLEMGSAELVCSVGELPREQWTRSGGSSVELLYRASSSMTPRPLARIASGGEVSRVMLACKVVLGAVDGCETLVFDEVDAGVGGSVAVSLAGVLADLAKTHQVIVVTHLAQVAVRGQSHYLVRKNADGSDGIPETVLVPVEGEDRVAEIARMLSGDASEASLAHAREMLAGCDA